MGETDSHQPLLHYLFEPGVSLKFLNGLLEVVGGIFLFFSTPESLSRLAAKLLTNELLEDPKRSRRQYASPCRATALRE